MKTRILIAICCLPAALMSGCKMQSFNASQSVFSKYYATTLKVNTSADVLSWIQDPKTEFLSQSESVVASWGVQDDEQTHWFNMVAFDEEDTTATRKYGFSLVERSLYKNAPPRPMYRLDGELVMPADLLEAAYPTQNARMTTVLEKVKEQFADDAIEVTADSQTLRSSTMMVKQALNSILVKLATSPALAVKLPMTDGLGFTHPTLGESRIRMLIENDTVKIKIKCGKQWFKKNFIVDYPFEQHPDVIHM